MNLEFFNAIKKSESARKFHFAADKHVPLAIKFWASPEVCNSASADIPSST